MIPRPPGDTATTTWFRAPNGTVPVTPSEPEVDCWKNSSGAPDVAGRTIPQDATHPGARSAGAIDPM